MQSCIGCPGLEQQWAVSQELGALAELQGWTSRGSYGQGLKGVSRGTGGNPGVLLIHNKGARGLAGNAWEERSTLTLPHPSRHSHGRMGSLPPRCQAGPCQPTPYLR